jgi:hypothetical protein
MEDNTSNNGQNANNNEQNTNETPVKTFTQAELDHIVESRVAEERRKADALREKAAKFDEMEEANKSELQKAQEKAAGLEAKLKALEEAETIRTTREKVAKETGVPADLLTGNDEETCKKQAQSILDFSKSNGYPVLKDGGEPQKTGKPSTRQQFADWLGNNS